MSRPQHLYEATCTYCSKTFTYMQCGGRRRKFCPECKYEAERERSRNADAARKKKAVAAGLNPSRKAKKARLIPYVGKEK